MKPVNRRTGSEGGNPAASTKGKKTGDTKRTCVLRLFVAGDGVNSYLARINLEKLLACLPATECDVTVIDVLEDPQAAFKHGVTVTPMLQVLEPEPGRTIYGNLSDASVVLAALRPGGTR